nr:MAG TPA: hypothetical protein [Bacteriophage sp.]
MRLLKDIKLQMFKSLQLSQEIQEQLIRSIRLHSLQSQ